MKPKEKVLVSAGIGIPPRKPVMCNGRDIGEIIEVRADANGFYVICKVAAVQALLDALERGEQVTHLILKKRDD